MAKRCLWITTSPQSATCLCTQNYSKTPVRDTLDVWPDLSLVIWCSFSLKSVKMDTVFGKIWGYSTVKIDEKSIGAISIPAVQNGGYCVRHTHTPPITAMHYNSTIKGEAVYCHSLGPNASENDFAGLYNAILVHWFGDSRGFVVGIHALPQRRYRTLIVRHHDLPGHLNPLLVLNLKRPSKWTPVGQQAVVDELAEHIKCRFDLTQHDTIYGLGAIGLHWVVCKMKSGDDRPTIVVDWQDNVASGGSYAKFETVANLIYNMASK